MEIGPGVLFGVHLAEKRGTMDGSHKDAKFFTCPEGHGVMVPARRIKQKDPSDATKKYFEEYAKALEAAAAKEAATQAEIDNTKAAKAFVTEIFTDIDADGSKSVEKSEFVKYFTDQGIAKDDVESLFTKIDVTKNGSISMAETDSWISSAKEEDAAFVAKFTKKVSASGFVKKLSNGASSGNGHHRRSTIPVS